MQKEIYKISPDALTNSKYGKNAVARFGEQKIELFELVGTAKDIWEVLQTGTTLDDLYRFLDEEWEDFGEKEKTEVKEFLDELVLKELVIKEES